MMLPISNDKCNCDLSYIAARPRTRIDSYDVMIVPGLPAKAQMFRGAFTIQVNADDWSRWNRAQRFAVLAHEMAHDEMPFAACESCVDMRAGARMRWANVPLAVACNALASVIVSRAVVDSVTKGWNAADGMVATTRALRDLSRMQTQTPNTPSGAETVTISEPLIIDVPKSKTSGALPRWVFPVALAVVVVVIARNA